MPDTIPTERLTFDVEGMTCASCAMRIERVLGKQEHVTSAVVNLAGKEARVEVSPDADIDALTAAVERIGYSASLVTADTEREDLSDRYDAETRYQRRMALLSAIFTVPAFALAMFGPDARWAELTVWALVTPVEFVFGWQFHRVAAIQARTGGANMDTLVSIGTLAAYWYSVWAFFADQPIVRKWIG